MLKAFISFHYTPEDSNLHSNHFENLKSKHKYNDMKMLSSLKWKREIHV
jgi:hypothetical protein